WQKKYAGQRDVDAGIGPLPPLAPPLGSTVEFVAISSLLTRATPLHISLHIAGGTDPAFLLHDAGDVRMPRKAQLVATAAATPPPRQKQDHADHKRSHRGFRGLPPPPEFDFDALPDGAMLNEYESAAVLRHSTNTLTTWRQLPGHPLKWVTVGDLVRYRCGDIRTYMASPRPRSSPPPPAPPAPPRPPPTPPGRKAGRGRGDSAVREQR